MTVWRKLLRCLSILNGCYLWSVTKHWYKASQALIQSFVIYIWFVSLSIRIACETRFNDALDKKFGLSRCTENGYKVAFGSMTVFRCNLLKKIPIGLKKAFKMLAIVSHFCKQNCVLVNKIFPVHWVGVILEYLKTWQTSNKFCNNLCVAIKSAPIFQL